MNLNRVLRALAIGMMLCQLVALGFAQNSGSRKTMGRSDVEDRQKASVQELAWLAGHWRGEGFGGTVEEVWMEPEGGSMAGAFRHVRDGELQFMEILQIADDDGSLALRVKHFTPEFVAWEDKENFVSFPLLKLEKGSAHFSGLTMQMTDPDTLDVHLRIKPREGEAREELLRFRRVR